MEVELWILLRLLIGCLLGGLVGYERGQLGKAAGLRTHMLIAMGATMFVSFTSLFTTAWAPLAPPGPAGNFRLQIEPLATIDAVVTGISFLGAGIIFSQGNKVKNLTTAASMWVTAAIGLAVGSTQLVLVILRVLPSSSETDELASGE